MRLLQSLDGVRSIRLDGSLASGAYDEHSDIDIGVDVSGSDDAEFACRIIAAMHESLDLHLHDWATALLPDHYVIAFYLKGTPLFWNVDVHCFATPHVASLTRDDVHNDPIAHLIKLWAIQAKSVLRGKVHEHLPILAERTLGSDHPRDLSPAHILKLALDEITRRANGRFPELIEQCSSICSAHL
jgi:hypothetical protein